MNTSDIYHLFYACEIISFTFLLTLFFIGFVTVAVLTSC